MVSTVPVAMPAERTQRLSPAEIQVMRSAAAYQARRIARSMRLPPHAVEDAEQEILLAIVMRRRYFDASRGPWLPFVQRVAAQAAQQVADAIATERRRCVGSLDEPLDEDGATLADRLVDPAPLPDPVVQLIAGRVIDALPPRLQRIAMAAIAAEGDYGEAGRAAGLSPVSFHRGIAEVRLRLRRHGIGPESGPGLGFDLGTHDLSEA